uniref:Uncharacterized protein n=1 Tax=Pseudomonas phage Arace01 TaxID=3138526 RepID=A0AAU6VZ03_9VIRU
MAQITQQPKVEVTTQFTVSELELRALDALAGYGDDAFIHAFYEKLGKAYMQKHEAGLRSFLKSIREIAPGIIHRTDAARKAFNNN